MAQYRIPYGATHLDFSIPDSFQTQVLAPAKIPPLADPTRAVNAALAQPAGTVNLENFARARSVAIAINDKTRPVPLDVLLPPLLQRLSDLGIPAEAITLVIATGTHPPMRPAEFASVLPAEILARYRVVSHDCDDASSLVDLGVTARGTPIVTNRIFAQADLRIALGNLEPHQFMGFSGGVKCAAIGLGGRATVTRNHAMMLDARANMARYDDNPVRQDVEEIGSLIGVHFALNSVINENHDIVNIVAGEPRAVMQLGMPLVLNLYRVQVAERFDLVITSPGGHPKDLNLYQAQKALAHATLIANPGGTVILCGACSEGTGSGHYDKWIADKHSHAQVLEAFQREGYQLGAHKAFMISRDASRERVLFVTDMPAELAQRCLLPRSASLDAALAIALRDLAPSARIGILPYANATIPVVTPTI